MALASVAGAEAFAIGTRSLSRRGNAFERPPCLRLPVWFALIAYFLVAFFAGFFAVFVAAFFVAIVYSP